jgi:hypothetical protein
LAVARASGWRSDTTAQQATHNRQHNTVHSHSESKNTTVPLQ